MIWKDYLKLSEIASYSKFARASKLSPPAPPRRNKVKIYFIYNIYIFSDRPGKPRVTLKETDIQTSYIILMWSSPVDNGGNPVLDYRVIVSGAANQTLEGVVCTEKLIEKLTPGKSYTVTVSARNSVGYSESDSWSFTTKSKSNVIF